MLSYEAVVLLAGFAAAAAVAAAAIADGALEASDAVRSAADVRAGQLAAGRIVVIDVQHAPAAAGHAGGGNVYVTVAPAGRGGGAPASIAGAWDSAGLPVACSYAGGAPLQPPGAPLRGPRTIACEPSDGLVLVARGGGSAGAAAWPIRVLP